MRHKTLNLFHLTILEFETKRLQSYDISAEVLFIIV